MVKFKVDNFEYSFSDADVVNPDDFVPAQHATQNSPRPWLLHDHGFTLAVVFATCLEDALDEAADAGKLDRFKVSEAEEEDYAPTYEGLEFLGNNLGPFAVENIEAVELPIPQFSFAALFAARKDG